MRFGWSLQVELSSHFRLGDMPCDLVLLALVYYLNWNISSHFCLVNFLKVIEIRFLGYLQFLNLQVYWWKTSRRGGGILVEYVYFLIFDVFVFWTTYGILVEEGVE